MGHYMTFTQDTDEKYKNKLVLYQNADDNLFLEISEDSPEPDMYNYQYITLSLSDAKLLYSELGRIIKQMESGSADEGKEESSRSIKPGTMPLFDKSLKVG